MSGSPWLLLAPPWLPLGCGWLLLAPPGSSRLLLAPPALHPPLASAVRPWGARAVLRPEHSRLAGLNISYCCTCARATNLMTQTLDDMGASWPQDFMIACRHMQVCVRRCVTWVASWPQDFMIACRHVQVCVCVCARVRYRREPMKRQKAQKAMTQTVIRWVIRGVWCSWLSPGSPPGPITDHKERR